MQAISALRLRAELYALTRHFFAQRNVLEVETPILSVAGNTEPNIESFHTEFSGSSLAGERKRWLRTSPEYPLKRLLAMGVGDCYELGRVFRNAEAGRRHNPEFTMLEWYRVGFDHMQLMNEVVELIQAALLLIGKSIKVVKLTYRELFHAYIDIDPLIAGIAELQTPLRDFTISPDGLTRDDWLDLLLTHRIEPEFPQDQLLLLYDYPASQCALAKIRVGDPPLAERFEVYLGRYELANGYHELTDADEQFTRFERDNVRRRARGQGELPIDKRLIASLHGGMPDCAGVALGMDRLLMYLLGTQNICDVLAFPFDIA